MFASHIASNPLGGLLGMKLVSAEPGTVALEMPFRHELTTLGDQVHGGAISALIDSAATAVAWSGVDPENTPSRGTTVNLEVNFMAPAKSTRLVATATVPRRGQIDLFLSRRRARRERWPRGARPRSLQARLGTSNAKVERLDR